MGVLKSIFLESIWIHLGVFGVIPATAGAALKSAGLPEMAGSAYASRHGSTPELRACPVRRRLVAGAAVAGIGVCSCDVSARSRRRGYGGTAARGAERIQKRGRRRYAERSGPKRVARAGRSNVAARFAGPRVGAAPVAAGVA